MVMLKTQQDQVTYMHTYRRNTTPHLPCKRHISTTLLFRNMIDPNPVLEPTLQVDLFSIAFSLMLINPQICV